MTAVAYTDGTERIISSVESMTRVWVSPATMDSNETVTVPTVDGATLRIINCWDNTTGDTVTATVSTFTVTIDASGGTPDHEFALTFMYEQG